MAAKRDNKTVRGFEEQVGNAPNVVPWGPAAVGFDPNTPDAALPVQPWTTGFVDPYSREALSTPAMPPQQSYYRGAASGGETLRNVGRAASEIGALVGLAPDPQATGLPTPADFNQLMAGGPTPHSIEMAQTYVLGTLGPHLPGSGGPSLPKSPNFGRGTPAGAKQFDRPQIPEDVAGRLRDALTSHGSYDLSGAAADELSVGRAAQAEAGYAAAKRGEDPRSAMGELRDRLQPLPMTEAERLKIRQAIISDAASNPLHVFETVRALEAVDNLRDGVYVPPSGREQLRRYLGAQDPLPTFGGAQSSTGRPVTPPPDPMRGIGIPNDRGSITSSGSATTNTPVPQGYDAAAFRAQQEAERLAQVGRENAARDAAIVGQGVRGGESGIPAARSDVPTSGHAVTNTPVPAGQPVDLSLYPQAEVKRPWAQKAADVLAFPLSAWSTYDMSAMRQLLKATLSHPTMAVPVYKEQFKAIGNVVTKKGRAAGEAAFVKRQAEIANDGEAWLRDIMGVEMASLGDNASLREEAIQSQLAERLLPGARRFNAGYVSGVNEARVFLSRLSIADLTEHYPDLMAQRGTLAGFDHAALAELQMRGRFINAATGRGNVGKAFAGNNILGQPLFWALRYRVAAAQTPLSMASRSAWVRGEAARMTGAHMGFLASAFAVGKATGAWDVEVDPRSPDWGQVRVGNRRFDLTSGTRPLVNLLARSASLGYQKAAGAPIANAKYVNTPSAQGDLYERKLSSVVWSYLRGSFQPVIGEFDSQVEGADPSGKKVADSIGGRVGHASKLAIPGLFLQQVAEEMFHTVPKGYQEGGVPGAAIEAAKSLGAAAIYGQGAGGSLYEEAAASGSGRVPSSRSATPRSSTPRQPTTRRSTAR